MTEINLTIDGRQVKAETGMTVLQAAQQAGIHIPTLCHHEKLEAFGGCRLCMVEVESRGWTSYVVSCLYPVAKDIVVRTRSEKVDKIRKVLVEVTGVASLCALGKTSGDPLKSMFRYFKPEYEARIAGGSDTK